MTWKPGESIFNLPGICGSLELEDVQEDDEGNKVKRVFLGTVFSLTPSGKFYAPWACSNVEPCSVCSGKGAVDSSLAGVLPGPSLTALHAVAQKVDWTLRSLALRFYGPACEGRWPDGIHVALRDTERAVAVLRTTIECPECEGVGSAEVMLDEKWREQADAELDEIGCWLESGEGDPCDLFAAKLVKETEQ